MATTMPNTARSLLGVNLLAAAAAVLAVTALADGATGRLNCEIKENGKSASGTVALEKDGAQVASGSCGKPLSAPPGSYTAVLGLDGALDGPVQQKPVTVQAGAEAKVEADFSTGTVTVRILQAGKPAAGMAVIRRDGKQVGTLGSGVAAHLSTGSYEITARYRVQQKLFEKVQLTAGQNVDLQADFE
jgi:hypothetical protein